MSDPQSRGLVTPGAADLAAHPSVPILAIVAVCIVVCGCAAAVLPLAELRAFDGTYTLSGAGPPDRRPLEGTLEIAEGHYVLDTTLGTCDRKPLKVPRPVMSTMDFNMVQELTTIACGDLTMRLFLANGRMPQEGAGSYRVERRVALPPVCVAFPSDSAAWERGDCARWRTDYDVHDTERFYDIRIARK